MRAYAYGVPIVGSALALVLATNAPLAAGDRSLAELVEAYRTGDRELAVAAVTLLSRERVEAEVERLVAILSRAGLSGRALRQAAAALLTESGVINLEAAALPRGRFELETAARLVQAGPAATRGGAFERRFYLVAGIALQAAGELAPAYDMLEQGLRVAGDDPELLTATGAVVETVAALRQYEPSPDADARRSRPGGYATESGGSGSLEDARLARAEALYEKALTLDPRLAEARLRRARVRVLRGRQDAALPDLERVALEGRDAGQRYLARLFEGRARDALDDARGAAAAYRAAAELVSAQSAFLALGRALDRLGDRGAAQEALEAASAAAGPDDPWWDYQSGQPARLDDLLVELRGLVE